jgi:cell division protein FtsI (penicillin-binding protein 3)
MATSPKHTYIQFFTVLIALILGIFFIRLAILMIFDQPKAKIYHDPEVAENVVRGTVYDRNGRILAIERPYWGVYLHLNMIDDMNLVSEVIAPYVQMSPSEIQLKAEQYTTYAQIKKEIDDRQVEPLRTTLREHGLQNQVNVEKRVGRTYPAQFHASQTIGFTNREMEGIEGIELTQESYLQPYPEIGKQGTTYGEDVTLTLDMDIQYALDVQLQQIADEFAPDYAMAMILDARNGDILGISSFPWYDINALGSSEAEERRNNAVNHLYEPGSVFKLFSTASILQIGEAKTDEPFLCDGSYTFKAGSSNVTINCSSAHGEVDVETMLAKSCNGAISHWALQTDAEAFYALLGQLGFTGSFDISLPSKAKAFIADPSQWSGRTLPTIAFGQELLVSALHLCAAATALSPSGELLAPHLILSRSSPVTGEKSYQRERTILSQVFDPTVTERVREGMHRATLSGGTGTQAQVEGVNLGVKTGTAQLFNEETGSYEDGTILVSTLAMVPIDSPEYIIYVGAGNPKGASLYGSNVAAPAVAAIVRTLVSQGKLITTDTTIL